jgi:hypothetical protein
LARDLLIKDLRSRDLETQHRAQLAFDLLNDYNVFQHAPDHDAEVDDLRRSVPGWRPNTARYPGNRDPAERDLRRRRREAMVLNEGDRPVSQEDVWMRDVEGRLNTDESSRPRGALEALTGEQERSRESLSDSESEARRDEIIA